MSYTFWTLRKKRAAKQREQQATVDIPVEETSAPEEKPTKKKAVKNDSGTD